MDCPEYLARFSDYVDGRADEALSSAMEAHEAACPACRRYSRTLREGVALLRSVTAVDVPPDFQARLDHRIFHIDDGASIARETLGSGATTFSILAVASLLALAAWAPMLAAPPTLELPALVVVGPLTPSFTGVPSRPTFSRVRSVFTSTGFQEGIWGDAHSLLFEYSSLSERRRDSSLDRTGVQ